MNKTYNYIEAMENDIRNYTEENGIDFDMDRYQIEEKLYDDLFIEDSVTGNASGSYTLCRWTAKEYVLSNIDLLKDAYENFEDKERFADVFFAESWEEMDVTIRCYCLGEAISNVLDEMNI